VKKFYFLILYSFSMLSAASGTWNLDADGNWNVDGNWDPGPFPNGSLDFAHFTNIITADRVITLGEPITASTIVFDGTNNYTIASAVDSLTFTAVMVGTTYATTNTYTITAPIVLPATTVQLMNSTTQQLILEGAISGPGAIQVSNAGPVVFSGTSANTYAGITNINTGNLLLQKTAGVNALPAGTTFISNGGSLQLGASNQIADTASLSMSSGGTFNLAGFSETIGNLTLNGATFSSGGGTLTLAGSGDALAMLGTNPTSSGSIALTGTGRIFATAVTGVATISGGTLDLGGSKSIVVNTGVTLLISNTISNGTVNKEAAGILILQASNTYSGGTSIFGGTVKLGVVDALPASGVVGLSTSGVSLDLNGFSPTINDLTGVSGTTITSSTAGAMVLTTGSGTNRSFSGVIQDGSGTVALLKQGSAIFTLGGANTYSGGTTVSAGTLKLSGTGSLLSTGSVTLSSATSVLDISALTGAGTTIGDLSSGSASSSVTLGAKALTFGTNTASTTFAGAVTGASGSLVKQGTGTVVLTGTNSYTGGTTISAGTLQLSGTGSLLSTGSVTLSSATSVFDISALTGADTTIGDLSSSDASSSAVLGTKALTFGTNTASTTFAGAITGAGGSLVKQGTGTVILTGTNSYTGGTTVSAGTLQGNVTSLQGNILNNANLIFNQVANGTYASVMSGTGTLDKQGTGILTLSNTNSLGGTVTVSAGTLSVNGTLAGGGSLTVAPGAALQGTGTITKNATINGTLSPGNSIGTIFLVGDQTFASGSTLQIELNPTASDLVSITGTLTIEPGSTLSINPVFGYYPTSLSYTIVHTTGGVTGMFSSITNSLPLLQFSIEQTLSDISLVMSGNFIPFSSFFNKGNAGKVAKCLDVLSTRPCSNLDSVIAALRFIPTESKLKEALLQMQPSAFTSLAIAQENDMVYMKNTIYNRLERQFCCCPQPQERRSRKNLVVWASGLGAHTSQKSTHEEPGFIANSPGAFVGIDSRIAKQSCIGGGVGYTHTHLNWRQHRGDANMQTAYASFYGQWNTPRAFVQSALIGGYNFYAVNREILFGEEGSIQETATSSHQGMEGSFNFKTGFKFKSRAVLMPFIGLNYIFIHENGFHEKGAQSLNLKVKSKNSDILISEAGIDLSRCIRSEGNIYTPFIRASVIRESRFRGGSETASFNCGCEMTVNGFYPSRTLGSIVAGLCSVFSDNNITVSYEGKFSKHYNDQAGYVQYLRRF
jgi:autotransporter-associated beta strand protein